MMMIALLAIPFAMQAQTKFHDVEANDAKGNVKSISMNMMGNPVNIDFTEDGKSKMAIDAVYDADGYVQSAKMSIMGQTIDVKYTWENGRVASQTMNMMGNDVKMTNIYDDKGVLISQKMGDNMEIVYTDYKFDDKGNWISRKTQVMGQEMTTSRTIVYY